MFRPLLFFFIMTSFSLTQFSIAKNLYLTQVRKAFLKPNGQVDWEAVLQRWTKIKNVKESLASKFYTEEVHKKIKNMDEQDQQRMLDIMMGGLCNQDSSVGVYATRPIDYDRFDFYLQPLLRAYHKIEGDTKQKHDWNIPMGKYDLTLINPHLKEISMRARVARNVMGWNLPPSMTHLERINFERFMEKVFDGFKSKGKYYSLTPGHKNQLTNEEADILRKKHFLFNDMTTDPHLTSSGVANDWPYGRGIWLSSDQKQMIWVGEEDQLRIISIVKGKDLGEVDASLKYLLDQIEASGVRFATHETYGVITTCPTNMGTGKRQSILGQFPRITKNGSDEKALKQLAKSLNLQARGIGGEHSSMDENGTADISPSGRLGVSERQITERLFEGLRRLYEIEYMRSEL